MLHLGIEIGGTKIQAALGHGIEAGRGPIQVAQGIGRGEVEGRGMDAEGGELVPAGVDGPVGAGAPDDDGADDGAADAAPAVSTLVPLPAASDASDASSPLQAATTTTVERQWTMSFVRSSAGAARPSVGAR